MLGAIARRYDDFSAAEDAVQEAMIAAAAQWPVDGIPENPRGWLYHIAMRRLTDHARSEMARRRREDAVASERFSIEAIVPSAFGGPGAEEDDTLTLLFMCCHPALTPSSSIALTLRAVGGLTTLEIANAFLVPEATMAQRISRAKQSIKTSDIPFRLPSDSEYVDRLGAVLHVLYLIFNEGYVTTAGPELHRADLSNEAIRLARMLLARAPHESEAEGLLALMLLTDARRAARTGPSGELIPLDEQDRSLWNQQFIAEGVSLVSSALQRGKHGPYALQAAIAAVHDEAPRVEDTDWPQILALYDVLIALSDNPMVALNRTVAVAMVQGAAAALKDLEALAADDRIATHFRLEAIRGHLHLMAGNAKEAANHFQAAAERTLSIPERDYLLTKAASLRKASAISSIS